MGFSKAEKELLRSLFSTKKKHHFFTKKLYTTIWAKQQKWIDYLI
jgi:hypothetical protein